MKPLYYLLCILSLTACTRPLSLPWGIAADYFPPAPVLQKGIVHKFYIHKLPKDKNATPSSNIGYYAYQTLADTLLLKTYNAGFRLGRVFKYTFEDNKMLLQQMLTTTYKGTYVQSDIAQNTLYHWAGQDAVSEVSLDFDGGFTQIFTTVQQKVRDTTFVFPCKQFKSDRTFTSIRLEKSDTTRFTSTSTSYYAQDKGLFAQFIETEDITYHYELIAQMPLSEFEKKATEFKKRKRIAYIDPALAMDKDADFQPCDRDTLITDYYGGERAQLQGGKGRWRRILTEELSGALPYKESGYLTFRFVINCRGEAGRFVTEQADLDFKPKTFRKETIARFYAIVRKQTDWQANYRGGEYRDAYTYITFKLKDGKLIEILP